MKGILAKVGLLMLLLHWEVWAAGQATNVLAFDPQNNPVRLAGVDDVSALVTGDFTLEVWVNLNAFGDKTPIVGVLQDNGNQQLGWALMTQSGNGFAFALAAESRVGLTYLHTAQGGVSSCNRFEVQRWHHVVGVYDATVGNMQIYVNGIPCNSTDIVLGPIKYPTSGNADFNLGPFDGQLSEARLWHQPRNEQEIRANMGKRLAGNETRLVGNWALDEGQSVDIIDKSAHFAVAKLNGPSSWVTTYLPFTDYIPPIPTCSKQNCGWYTQGSKIHQPDGSEFKIKAINWFGFQSPTNLVHGLWQVDFSQQLDKIKALGFNSIRLPYAHSTLLPGATVDSFIAPLPGKLFAKRSLPSTHFYKLN